MAISALSDAISAFFVLDGGLWDGERVGSSGGREVAGDFERANGRDGLRVDGSSRTRGVAGFEGVLNGEWNGRARVREAVSRRRRLAAGVVLVWDIAVYFVCRTL